MLKKISLLFFILALFISYAKAQAQYGNEWIVPSQPYYKLSTAKNGMYALTRAQLQAAGVPNLNSVDPRNFQIWHRGVEQKILVTGEADGVFNNTDSLIFYGKINDGTMDTKVYQPTTSQPHTYYNIYNDTTAFFLTWGSTPSTKRITKDLTSSAPVNQAFHMESVLKIYADEYSRGKESGEAKQTYGDIGETWCSNAFEDVFNETIPLSNVNTSGMFTVEIMLVGRNQTSGRVETITIGNLSTSDIVETFAHPGPDPEFNKAVFSKSYPSSSLGTSSITIKIEPNNNGVNPNRISVAYIKITYPQNTDMNGATTKFFHPSVMTQSYFTITNFPSGAAPIVYDLTDKENVQILNDSITGSNVKVFIPATGVTEFIAMKANAYLNVPVIKKANMNPYDTTRGYLILTHPKLWAAAKDYATYRKSPEGGGHDTLRINVQNIYDQFGYGEFNPIAIKNFCSYQIAYNKKVKNLFIIGKGFEIDYGARLGDQLYRKNPTYYINNTNIDIKIENLVPPYGAPPSDIFYSMKYDVSKSRYMPGMAVGRLSAKYPIDVEDYLNKVKEHEKLDSNLLWRKQLVHVSGGAETTQINLFRSYVDGYKNIVETSSFRGKVVRTFSKNPNGPTIEEINLSTYVNAGLNMVTFFGHAAWFLTEVNIGTPAKATYGYDNGPKPPQPAKYPFMILNGCETAAVYFTTSLAEEWVNTAEKGAIGVIGVSDIGYTSPLDYYCSSMYRGLFDADSLKGKSVGEVMKNVLKTTSFDDQTTMQMNLHGDPEVKIYSPKKSDYEISGDNDIRDDKPELRCFIKSFDNQKVTATSDSFLIGIPVKNFGAYDPHHYLISVTRTVNGKETIFDPVLYAPVDYVDTLFFIIRGNKPLYYGMNQFKIELDAKDSVKEMRENNNEAILNYFMSLSAVTCLFPKEYSIVHDQPVTFVAQSADLLIKQKVYYFELDTSYLFNSGFKKTGLVTSGSLVKWKPSGSINLFNDNNTDSIVYYWRVRYNNIADNEDTTWGISSFIYIKDSPDGWSQAQAPQFVNDIQKNIYMDLSDSTWKFSNTSIRLKADVYGNLYRLPGDSLDIDYTNFYVNTPVYYPGYLYYNCGNPGFGSKGLTGLNFNYKFDRIIASHMDRSSLTPESGGCGNWSNPVLFTFYQGNGLYNWLKTIPDGDFIFLASTGNVGFDNAGVWQPIKDSLATYFGAQQTALLNDNEPYILVAKKGASLPIFEAHSDDPQGVLHLDTLLLGQHNNGKITSTRIGPATEWGTFYQRIYAKGQDHYLFKIQGEDLNGNITDLPITLNFAKNADNIDTLDLKGPGATPLIDAKQYPYIRLVCTVSDSSALIDPPQLDRWQVIYHKSPEGTMNPYAVGLDNYIIPKKDEGEQVCIPYEFDNISDIPFGDSLYVKITAKGDGPYVKIDSVLVHKDSLKAGESFRFNYCLNTKNLYGKVHMTAFVNPYIQPEEFYTNNIVETGFDVTRDRIPPVMDITFDGVHIMDGDMVSPSPIINITLNDNSKYLIMKDPDNLNMKIFFKYPNGVEVQIDPKHNKDVTFTQLPGSSNTFTIAYHPKNLPDGDYKISAEGTDVNGNPSGQRYTITFHVENASTISNFYPYPNPFSTSTRFVFTLSGRYIPDDLKIQIMTVTGKVVREITKEELGHIHIGNNKTEYAWNGTDEFGDKLANGVYLYRVIIKNRGDNFEHRNTAGDKAFHKEFGKIYILR
jgi:hypothetical protein